MSLRFVCRLILCLIFAAGSTRAQSPPAAESFQAVHLLWIDVQQPNAEEAVEAAITSLNDAISKAGCPPCTYHLWKVVDAPTGSYNYVQVSNWPSGAVYEKIHASPEYIVASRNWGSLRSVVTKEVYNRYVETPLVSAHSKTI